MADNTDEEHSDNQANTQPENPSDEIIPAKNTGTIHPNQEPENMEVHNHPHHVTHKKKWGEYLLEFFMLFLAVFLGFVAENIREHAVEHDRSKEYAISLVQDLQNDTASITVQMKSGERFIAITDSLLNLSKERLEGRTAAEFSFYTRFMYWTVPLSWNRATFEQIKNSGSLRYFKNYQLLEKLMKYDGLVNEIEGEYNNHQTRGNMLLKLINQIIDPEFHHDLSKHRLLALDTMSEKTMEYYFSAKIESLETKRSEIKEMLNMIVVQQRNLRFGNDTRLQRAKNLATELISDLKKEYHIE
jgi:hypothetical protein